MTTKRTARTAIAAFFEEGGMYDAKCQAEEYARELRHRDQTRARVIKRKGGYAVWLPDSETRV